MNLCNHCGVELDLHMKVCPLCGLPVGEMQQRTGEPASGQQPVIDGFLSEIANLTGAQKRKLFWEVSGIILGSGMVVTLLINIILHQNISWAKYSTASSVFLFATITVFTFWRKRSILLVVGSFISSSLFLLLLDLLSFNIGWGIRLGIPILVSLYVLLIIVRGMIRISTLRGFNILAIIFLSIGLFLVCIEGSILLYNHDPLRLSWSIIAGSCMIPIAALMLLMHYRLKKGIDLKRFFHI